MEIGAANKPQLGTIESNRDSHVRWTNHVTFRILFHSGWKKVFKKMKCFPKHKNISCTWAPLFTLLTVWHSESPPLFLLSCCADLLPAWLLLFSLISIFKYELWFWNPNIRVSWFSIEYSYCLSSLIMNYDFEIFNFFVYLL